MDEFQPATVAVVEFIDCINRGDVDGLARLMTDDHVLQVMDEPPLVGRDANVEAWRGYATSFPDYVIAPHEISERAGTVAVLGHTTGSHLALPDDEEAKQLVVWIAEVDDGRLTSWRVVDDSPEVRSRYGLA